MKRSSVKRLKTLVELNAVPGQEHQVRAYMKEQLSKLSDEIIQDKLGSIFAVKRSKVENAPKVMLAGHMDEVGFMITGFNEYGLVKFQPLGGWWNQNMLAQRVNLHTEDKVIPGVISSVSPHLLTPEQRNKPMEITKMLIDVGVSTKAEAEELGLKIGQMITPQGDFVEMANGKTMLGKAFDDRYGCAIAIEVLESLKDVELPCDLYVGATVQEESGLRGARTASYMIDPDIFIAVDASPARDTSGPKTELGRLGEGFLVRIHDRSMILGREMRDHMLRIATKKKIKHQYYTSPGGTDAGAVHINREGVPSCVIGIPARNIHSHSSIMHKDDYDAAFKMTTNLIKSLNTDTVNKIKGQK
jgi:putative aminopeptidase FrvX